MVGDYKIITQEQITKLITSGLYNEVDHIFTGISYRSIDDTIWFLELLKNYNKFFPIIHSDNSGEKPTLRFLANYAKEKDCYIMYFHTKAISNTGYNNTMWRLSMDYNIIYRWKECISFLEEGYDAVGCNLRKNTHVGYHPHFSGTYWWTKSEYVKTLDENYLYDKELLGIANTLTAEFFIGSNHSGKLMSVFECKNEAPYKVECLVSEYIKC